jgi:uncharacterized protein CbrC (UPF0167 family)
MTTDSSPTLPRFRYHPDPVATGSVEKSAAVCRSCARARGYIYTGPAYGDEELTGAVCPWCIADGSAAAKFSVEFVDADGIGDYGSWGRVPSDVIAEITTRTPGFTGWQQERWWTHCGDGAEFIGVAGRAELESHWPDAIPAIRAELGGTSDEWDYYYARLSKDGAPTAYVFRCRHCGLLGGYSDSH